MRYGKLTLYVGPMFAGKSTKLLQEYNRVKRSQYTTSLLVKPIIDNRYAANEVVTHNGLGESCYVVKTLSEMFSAPWFRTKADKFEKEKSSELYTMQVYIDECHFFEDLVPSLRCLLMMGIDVFCAGLNMTSEGKVFANMEGAFGLADKVQVFYGCCSRCLGKSKYTIRKFSDNRECLVGGSDLYEPVCGSCFVNWQRERAEREATKTATGESGFSS